MKTTDQVLTGGVASKPSFGKAFLKWEPFAMLYARFALGAAFLSAVAARFGIWGDNTGPDSFKHFIEYTAEPRLPPGQDLQFSYLRALCAFVVKSVPGVPGVDGVDGVDGVSKGGPYSPHP
jgi:hypothetical protein